MESLQVGQRPEFEAARYIKPEPPSTNHRVKDYHNEAYRCSNTQYHKFRMRLLHIADNHANSGP